MSRVRWLLPLGLLLPGGCGWDGTPGDGPPVAGVVAPGPGTTAERIDRELVKAGGSLMSRQSPDGAWRSQQYGAFKDGAALTPSVLVALQQVPDCSGRDAACRKALDYLAGAVRPDGSIDERPHGLSYPVYTSAGAVRALSRSTDPAHQRARDAWLRYLRERQLTEAVGWQPADKEYGGWGYAVGVPRKPAVGQPTPPLTESNLSATAFALEALDAAGVPIADSAYRKALVFVKRCQNYGEDASPAARAFDDGGFFFIYDDPVRNKAGVAGTDPTGRVRFRSYGSTTADGLRALLLCGLSADDKHVVAARFWFAGHFQPNEHPGAYVKGREANQNAVYFYYCCSVGKCIRALRNTGPVDAGWPQHRLGRRGGGGSFRVPDRLAEAVLARQGPDGPWTNEAVAVREDDPLVATSLAVEALAACRASLGEH